MLENIFLSIGAMKTGTTWLYEQLKEHPSLHFSPIKELHYFAHRYGCDKPLVFEKRVVVAQNRIKKMCSNSANPLDFKNTLQWCSNYINGEIDEAWLKKIMNVINPEIKYVADFSNLTCHLSADEWVRLCSEVSKLRAIYIMRDPINRIWSHYKFHLMFSKNKAAKKPADNFELFKMMLSKPWFINNAMYSQVVQTLRASLEPDQFMLCYYEDMIFSPIKFLNNIEVFLSVDAGVYNEEKLKKKIM
jgi:hypothetical protein